MVRKFLIGLPIIAAILAMGAGVALSKHEDKAAGAPDMSGWWSLDASKSDAPPGMGGPGGWEGRGAVPTFAGAWNKGKLEIVRNGSRGTMKQSFALEEDGKDLVIRTTMAARDSRPSREFKRVYRRTST